jgi:hypothetical protein
MDFKKDFSLQPHEFLRFNSSEEMDRFKMMRNLQMTDVERFKTFLALMRIGKKLKNAPKIHKEII